MDKYNIIDLNKAKQALKRFLEFLKDYGYINDIHKLCNPIYVKNIELIKPLVSRLTQLNDNSTFFIHDFKIGKCTFYEKSSGIFKFDVTIDAIKTELRVKFDKIAEKRTGKIVYECGACPVYIFKYFEQKKNAESRTDL